MEIKKKIVVRKIAGDTLLIPVGSTVGEYNGVFTLTPTAAAAFSAIQRGEDEEGVLRAVLDEFDIDEETAGKDIDEFLLSLREFGII